MILNCHKFVRLKDVSLREVEFMRTHKWNFKKAWHASKDSHFLMWLLLATGQLAKVEAALIALKTCEHLWGYTLQFEPGVAVNMLEAIKVARAWVSNNDDAANLKAVRALGDKMAVEDYYTSNDARVAFLFLVWCVEADEHQGKNVAYADHAMRCLWQARKYSHRTESQWQCQLIRSIRDYPYDK